MAPRFQIFCVYLLSLLAIWHIERSTHQTTVHKPAKAVLLSTNTSERPYYTTGPITQVSLPKLSLLDIFSRKKIDNFVFNHYNHYKLEFTFVDVGYGNSFMFTFYGDEYQPFRITEKVGFDLREQMLDGKLNLDLHKKDFDLVVRQYRDQIKGETITTFNVSLTRRTSSMGANLTHITRNKQCFTAIRSSNNIVSHKCLGGYGSGVVRIDHVVTEDGEQRKQSNMLNLSLNLTRVLYDGLRGSGMHWRWVWGEFNGFSKIQFYDLNHTIPMEHGIAINFGHIFGQGEDFACINGRVFPIEGLQYTFNENMKVTKNVNITVTATKPRLAANFTVLSVHHTLQNMGIVKVDLVKAEGKWAGWIEDEKMGKNYTFYEIIGMIEASDSLF